MIYRIETHGIYRIETHGRASLQRVLQKEGISNRYALSI